MNPTYEINPEAILPSKQQNEEKNVSNSSVPVLPEPVHTSTQRSEYIDSRKHILHMWFTEDYVLHIYNNYHIFHTYSLICAMIIEVNIFIV